MTSSAKPPTPGRPARPRDDAARRVPLLSALARPLLAMALLIVIAVLAMPGTGVRALGEWWPGVTLTVRRLNWMVPGFDMFHALLFAMTGLLAVLAFPYAGIRRLLLVLFVLAALTEYIQIWVPGRTSSLLELGVDLVGAAAGVLLGLLVAHALGLRAASVR